MSEQALYRKYRPHTFEEVLGQEHITATLKHAIEKGTLSHAYLFAGSRGTGKTSLARIVARAIGTTDRDLHEIDAASNRGIDDVRILREEVHTLPFESTYKVYVIDEVHMLTKEAFNALLKTLEEPPRHVIFILATTELEKLPDTIVSRCQVFTFKTPGIPVLKEMLLTAAKKEKRSLTPAGAELIALLASGSFRDAYGVLQKVLSSTSDGTIETEQVETVAGTPKSTMLLDMLQAISEGNSDSALCTVRVFREAGHDMRFVLTLLLRLVRAVLLLRSAPSLASELEQEFSQEEFPVLREHAERSTAYINSQLLARLLDASMQTGTTYTPELPLELALIDHLQPTS